VVEKGEGKEARATISEMNQLGYALGYMVS
jgi:hypothetical protein